LPCLVGGVMMAPGTPVARRACYQKGRRRPSPRSRWAQAQHGWRTPAACQMAVGVAVVEGELTLTLSHDAGPPITSPSSTFLSEQISISHQPPAKRTG
jgi:hypothetical protein